MDEEFKGNNYTQHYAYYTDKIISIRQAKIRGEVIVAKPVLMLALIDGIESGVFTNNRFVLNEWLEEHYMKLMLQYTRQSQFDKPTEINNPFWHLSTDGFWHLQLKTKGEMRTTPSKAWLKENVTSSCFDEDLWVLLQSKEWRTRLRDFIVEYKLIEGC
jgi:putative restriction endonuclease